MIKKNKIERISNAICTIDDVMEQAISIKEMSKDVVMPLNQMYFSENGSVSLDGGNTMYEMTEWSLGQLGAKLRVPAQYIERCIENGRGKLAKANIDSWNDKPTSMKFRITDDHLRALVTKKYSVFDSANILETIKKSSFPLEAYDVRGYFLSDEILHLRFCGKDKMNIEGEELFPMLTVDSSDVGRRKLSVTFGIYRLVCTNGLMISKAGGTIFQQKHVGITAEEFREGMISSIEKVPVLTEQAEEWVKAAKEGVVKKNDVDAFLKTLKVKEEENVKEFYSLMYNTYDVTYWGLINTITEYAQRFDLDRRREFEYEAGNILVKVSQ